MRVGGAEEGGGGGGKPEEFEVSHVYWSFSSDIMIIIIKVFMKRKILTRRDYSKRIHAHAHHTHTHTHTQARARAHTHTHTHADTRTHEPTDYIKLKGVTV